MGNKTASVLPNCENTSPRWNSSNHLHTSIIVRGKYFMLYVAKTTLQTKKFKSSSHIYDCSEKYFMLLRCKTYSLDRIVQGIIHASLTMREIFHGKVRHRQTHCLAQSTSQSEGLSIADTILHNKTSPQKCSQTQFCIYMSCYEHYKITVHCIWNCYRVVILNCLLLT